MRLTDESDAEEDISPKEAKGKERKSEKVLEDSSSSSSESVDLKKGKGEKQKDSSEEDECHDR